MPVAPEPQNPTTNPIVLGGRPLAPPEPTRAAAQALLKDLAEQAATGDLTPAQYDQAAAALDALRPSPASEVAARLHDYINRPDRETWSRLERLLREIRPLTRHAIELQAPDPPEEPWLIPGWLPRRQLTLIAGGKGSGRTWLALQLALALAAGQAVFLPPAPGTELETRARHRALESEEGLLPTPEFGGNLPRQEGPVLYAGYRQSLSFIYRRLRRLSGLLNDADPGDRFLHIPLDSRQPLWLPQEPPPGILSPAGQRLQDLAATAAAALLVIDSLEDAIPRAALPQCLHAFLTVWTEWCQSQDCPVALLAYPHDEIWSWPGDAVTWRLSAQESPGHARLNRRPDFAVSGSRSPVIYLSAAPEGGWHRLK